MLIIGRHALNKKYQIMFKTMLLQATRLINMQFTTPRAYIWIKTMLTSRIQDKVSRNMEIIYPNTLKDTESYFLKRKFIKTQNIIAKFTMNKVPTNYNEIE